MNSKIENFKKRDHTVVIPNYHRDGSPLERWQLGWQQHHILEAKSSVSKDIWDYNICVVGLNLVFHYIEDKEIYGLHTELYTTPFFRFRKNSKGGYDWPAYNFDTHDFESQEVLCYIEKREDMWTAITLNGKNLEEVLANSYIIGFS